MKFKSKEEKKNCFKLMFIALALVNVMFPILFVMIVELSMEINSDVYFTNGFFNVMNVMRIYHVALWTMIVISFSSSLFILFNIENIIKSFKTFKKDGKHIQ